MSELPPINDKNGMTINVLCQLFFKQLMTFAEFMNESPNVIENEKYADFILYALTQELHKIMDKKGIKYPETE